MRRNHFFFVMVGMAAILFLSSAQAQGFVGYFGTQERIKCIQPINEERPAGDRPVIVRLDSLNRSKYNLCYKYSMKLFIAGVSLHDDGYVLAGKDDASAYIPLDSARITELQEKGVLPNPLPAYTIPLSQYLAGYSLWLLIAAIIAGLVSWLGIRSLWDMFKAWKYKGKLCLNCGLTLTIKDFSGGKCGACSEPIPDSSSPVDSMV